MEVVRDSDVPEFTTKILTQSDCLVRVIRDILKDVRNLSWNTKPFKVNFFLRVYLVRFFVIGQINPQLPLAFLPQLKSRLKDRRMDGSLSEDEQTTEHLSFLIDFLEEYHSTLKKINTLLSNDEISLELLWAIMAPRSILFTSCQTTSKTRAVRLLEVTQLSGRDGVLHWRLICEYIDRTWDDKYHDEPFELVTMEFKIQKFEGAIDIFRLVAYPLERHPNCDFIRQNFLIPGGKCLDLDGFHKVRYSGLAYAKWEYGAEHTE